MFQFTQRVAEAANRLAAHRAGCDAPFEKGFVRTRNRFVVIVVGSGTNAGESPTVDRRNFVNHRAAAATFTIEHAGVAVCETQLFQRCFHKQLGYCHSERSEESQIISSTLYGRSYTFGRCSQSSLRSSQLGFVCSTRAIFLLRRQPLSFFSHAIASLTLRKCSNHTGRFN